MDNIFHLSTLFGRRLNWFIERLCALLVALMVMDVWLGVLSRYLLDLQITWTEELARYLMIWAALLAVSCGVHYREHVGLMLILEKMPRQIRRWFSLILDLVGLGFFLILFYYGYNLSSEGATQYANIFNITMALPYAAVPVSAGLAALQMLLVALKDFARVTGKDDAAC